MNTLLQHLRGNVVAYVALFLALTMGTAWALEKNSVKSKNIVDGQVKAADLAKDSVKSKNIARGQVKAADLGDLIPRDYELSGVDSPTNSADKTIDADCPDGKLALSGSVLIDGGEGFVAISESRQVNPPLTPYTGWRASAIEVNGGTAEPWKITVFAQCADLGI